MLEVTLLGCGGMMPMKNRWLTSCYILCNGRAVLIDCGEGTQIALKNTTCKAKKIDMICITHFHADHISGLPGFLLSMGNEGREEKITIAGPRGIERIVKSLTVIASGLPFEIDFAEVEDHKIIGAAGMEITPFRLRHGLECFGYSFYLPRSGKFDPEKARLNNVPQSLWSRLQKNEETELDGRIFTPDMVLGEVRKGIKLTYCTDTRPCKNISASAAGSELFICEGLYYEQDKAERAVKTGHMLFSEAARLAADAGVKEMWLTHYSPAVKDPEQGLAAAREIFPDSYCGCDGKRTILYYPED